MDVRSGFSFVIFEFSRFAFITQSFSSLSNKKVLLRERKRHNTRRITSACSAALSPDGWRELPHPVLMGGTPIHSQQAGVVGSTIQSCTLEYPISARWRYPPQSGRYPQHPISHRCEQTKNITYNHPSDAGGKYMKHQERVKDFPSAGGSQSYKRRCEPYIFERNSQTI